MSANELGYDPIEHAAMLEWIDWSEAQEDDFDDQDAFIAGYRAGLNAERQVPPDEDEYPEPKR